MTRGEGAQREATTYQGRFAPSPTGPLHAGSLVAALASWLDARAWEVGHSGRGGRWLVRIEDVDTPRCVPGAADVILQQLATCGLLPDAPPVWQSARGALYQQALDQLIAQGHAYPCACSRKDIEDAHAAQGHDRTRHATLLPPGTCRHGLRGRPARSWRSTPRTTSQNTLALIDKAQAATFSIADGTVRWADRRLGPQAQHVASAVGDFVLRRADGLWAYQLAVVVDDAAQHITHVVRGEDLADNTPRQILLQQAGGADTSCLHTPWSVVPTAKSQTEWCRSARFTIPCWPWERRPGSAFLGRTVTKYASGGSEIWVNAWARTYNGPP
jgi:glutamyl-Q tRNA(Asp) synthetase